MKASHLALIGVAALALVMLARRGPAAPAPAARPTAPATPKPIGLSDFDPTAASRFGPVLVGGAETVGRWLGGLFADSAPRDTTFDDPSNYG